MKSNPSSRNCNNSGPWLSRDAGRRRRGRRVPRVAPRLHLVLRLLDALDVDYDVPCIGTALYSIQSGFNHDCDPNAAPLKDENDKTGACVIVARRPISAGEEITISYLADSSNQTRDARQDALADYGFTCRCERCERDFLESRRR